MSAVEAMKICAVICEYNPFHNGHKYLIEQAKRLSGCDAVLCIMSGNFTQRGEAAVLPKFVRAEHAVRGGADCAIQLPAAFSVAPAEIFAQGAISILKSIPAVTRLAFGSEVADARAIESAARLLCDTDEGGCLSEKFTASVAEGMERGESYKRSAAQALEELGAEGALVNSPNGILATEYARAIKKLGANMDILPVLRVGAGYGDEELKDNFSSASAIRANLGRREIEANVPPYVLDALKGADMRGARDRADAIARYALAAADRADMARIFGCTEGLENKLKADAHFTCEEIVARATSRRYTSSRIRRILAANMLGLYADDVKRYIAEGTYIKPLAVSAALKDGIFAELAKASLPVIIKKMSLKALSAGRGMPETAAERCYAADRRADFVRALIFGEAPEYDFTVKTV